MEKLMGCLLVIIGCAGFAGSYCREAAVRLHMLKQIRSIYEDMKYYITYQKAAIPEALWRISQKAEEPFAGAFLDIYQRTYEYGEDLILIWRQQMEKALICSPLTKKEKRLVYDFAACFGYMEEAAQAGAIDELQREVNLQIEELERDKKSKNKIIMSFGVAAGILISILLL